ncbi:MAG TPA: DUF2085 domain-containing protein [Thermoanaerobaculia bacterium]|nr:DUF2085 domain-containing protein [Thermoanaerobaculia bacterium]
MKRDTWIVAGVLGAIAGAIAAGSLLCTIAVAEGASPQWKLLFRLFCHGMPERSLTLFGEAMPICARCFGIYAGLLLGLVTFLAWPKIEERAARLLTFAAALPITIDGVTQAAGLRTSTNALRIATGLAVAIAFAIWALAAVEQRRSSIVTTS